MSKSKILFARDVAIALGWTLPSGKPNTRKAKRFLATSKAGRQVPNSNRWFTTPELLMEIVSVRLTEEATNDHDDTIV